MTCQCGIYELALQRRDQILTEIEKVDRFLLQGRPRSRMKAIVAAIDNIMRQRNEPMQRGEIREALESLGIEIPGQDKSKYLGTIMWRNRDRFPGSDYGYVLASAQGPDEERSDTAAHLVKALA